MYNIIYVHMHKGKSIGISEDILKGNIIVWWLESHGSKDTIKL